MRFSSLLSGGLDGFRPNRPVGAAARAAFTVATIAALLLLWQHGPAALPRPTEIAQALATLWNDHGLADELTTSLWLNLRALAWSTAIALGLAYLSVTAAARPLVSALSTLRFSGLVGWTFVLALVTSGASLKLWMVVLGMTPFFVTSMAAVVDAIPRERYEHARTLGLGSWRIVWEVVVRGTADQALESLRHNAAIGWAMLTTVEGVVRGEGGLGAMLLNHSKHLQLDAVFALILVVLAIGLLQDRVLVWLRRALFPYAVIAAERS
ncbi:MAG: ABC transporter permease subunit [Deltaproteobacteria bacterium]|nr:ABC transporter permease subunit [Deltaproteobacteria bacterium]